MPKLSIIIPTLNSRKSIGKCLQSVSRQTFTDYEIVVQDCFSSDNTIALIEEFQKANAGIMVMVNQERDRGAYDAMNRSIRRANGEWLYFLGSDDELHDRDVLKTMMNDSGTALHNVMYGNVKVVGDTDWADNGSVYDGAFDLEKLLRKNICHQAIFYRSIFIKQIGEFNINYTVCADWDFNMRCWSKAKFKYVDLVVAKFYAGGISSGSRPDVNFGSQVAANVIKYFNLSIYDPLVNRPAFAGFGDILKMQQSAPPLRRIATRIFRTVIRRLKSLGSNY